MKQSRNDKSNTLVSVRQATRADVSFLAQIDHIASIPPFERSIWDQYLEGTGTPTVRFLEAMLDEDASNWGRVEDFIIIEIGGTAAAACAVYVDVGGERGIVKLTKLPNIARRLGWDQNAINNFRAEYEKDWAGDDTFLKAQAEATIESVGVLPEFRGRGLGDRLMRESKAKARRDGHASIGVMVVDGNDRAQRLYERHFERHITYHSGFFGGRFPGLIKYRAELGEAQSDQGVSE